MTIDFTLDENDFLTHQLYVASKSERIKRKRQRNRIILPILYASLGIFFLFQDKVTMAVLFIAIGLLWFFIYPIWESQRYIAHYKDFIKENFKARVDRAATIEFTKEYILAKDSASESKVASTELQEICEIPTTILVRLKGGQSIILPKHKIADIEKVKAGLKELAGHLNIKYTHEEKWEWR